MPIVVAQSTLTNFDLAVPLSRYARIIQNTECGWWGVADDDNPEPGCRHIWLKSQRDDVGRYLGEAQDEIEQQVNYPLHPKWFADERQNYACPVQADWGHIVQAGVRAESNIELGATVDHTSDPAVIGPIATTVTDINEIRVYHPGTDVEIDPSAVTITGGNVTITIPRCRLVRSEFADNPKEGWPYSDLTYFEEEVDVKRVYNDPSVNAELVWPGGCGNCEGCTERTQAACMRINHAEAGIFEVRPATYANGAWGSPSSSFCCRGRPQIIRLNYKAGWAVTPQQEDAIVRLAHSKMPDEFCGCEVFTRLWRRDREVPGVLTRERLNCPFGINTGAWIAWRFAQSFKLYRGATF